MLNKKFNQSMFFDTNNSPYVFKTKLSCDINKSKTGKGKNIVSFKSSLKKIEKDKFKNIPKNEKLMNFPVLDNNNNNYIFRKPNQRKTSFANSLSNKINFGDEGNIQKKVNENNNRVSSIIPVSRNRHNCSKMKTIKENDDLVHDMLKKNGHCRKKTNKLSVTYFDDKYSKKSKKHKDNEYYSSNTLIKLKKKKNIYSNKLTEIDNHTRNISTSIPKTPKKEIKEINHSNKASNKNIKEKRSSKKKDYNIRDSKTSENKKDKSNIKERKINEFKKDSNTKNDKCLDIRESKISNKKHKNINDNKNEKNNELKNAIDINNVKTKTEYDIENCTIKEKKKKYYGFPFCCLTQNGDNSSDNE